MSKEAQNMVLQESITNSIPFHALAFHYIILCARGVLGIDLRGPFSQIYLHFTLSVFKIGFIFDEIHKTFSVLFHPI